MTDPRELAIKLLKATSSTDEEAFSGRPTGMPGLTLVDYQRIACRILFSCERCGTCCTTGDPIRLRREDAAAIARHIKLPLNKAIKKYTIPDPKNTGELAFKKTLPCRFYDPCAIGCKIYCVRPWSCRIFPFLGIYGSEGQVKVHQSCPGSVKAIATLEAAIDEVKPALESMRPFHPDEVKAAKVWFNERLNELC